MLSQTKCTATGFVIEPLGKRRILTNAHAVANQVQVKVRKHGSAQKYTARVLAVGHEVRGKLNEVMVNHRYRHYNLVAVLKVVAAMFCGWHGRSQALLKSFQVLKDLQLQADKASA